MAVQYVKGGNGLGLLGGLATIGGALTGNPFISALGTGLGMMNGQAGGAGGGVAGLGSLEDILNGIVCGGWYNPAGGSIAKKNISPMPSDEEIYKNWAPYNKGGYYSWPQ